MNSVKIGICEWCIPEKEKGSIKLAKDMGYSGIVLDLGDMKDGFPISKRIVQEAYVEQAELYGIRLSTLAVNQLCTTGMVESKNYETICEILDVMIKTACSLEIKLLQVPSFVNGFIKSEDDFLNTSRCLKYVCQRAKEKSITVGTENGLDAKGNLKMLEVVSEDNLKIYFDTANPLWLADGLDAPKILLGIKDYLCEVHAKDVGKKTQMAVEILYQWDKVKSN